MEDGGAMSPTCGYCETPVWAPEDMSVIPHGWCHVMCEWVEPAYESCSKAAIPDETLARIERETEEDAEELSELFRDLRNMGA